jgi:hypothetical protein
MLFEGLVNQKFIKSMCLVNRPSRCDRLHLANQIPNAN